MLTLLMSEIVPKINRPHLEKNNTIATWNSCSNNARSMGAIMMFIAINDGANRHATIHHSFSMKAEDTNLTVTDPNLNNADVVQ